MSTSLSSGTDSGASLRALDKCLILLAALPLSLAFSSVSPVLPKMAADLAHSPTDAYLVKMVAGIIGLAVVISGPLTGLFADKAPRRLMLVLSGLIFAIAGAAPFFLDDLRVILVTRFLTGVAATAIYIGGVSMVGDFATADRARWMGRFEALAMFVGVVALPLAGLLGDRGWHLTFVVYLIGIPFALLAWFSREGSYRLTAHKPPSQQPADTAPLRSLPVGLIVLAVLIGIVTYVPAMYIPFHLAELGVRSPSAIGALLMLSVIIASLASTQFGRARRVLSAASAFGCSFAALAVGIGLIVVSSTYQLAIVGLLVMGLGIAWMSPNLSASTVDAVSVDRRGFTLGVVRAAHSLAPAVGVAMLEPLVSRIGVRGILMLNVALALLLAGVTTIQALKSRSVILGTERARVG